MSGMDANREVVVKDCFDTLLKSEKKVGEIHNLIDEIYQIINKDFTYNPDKVGEPKKASPPNLRYGMTGLANDVFNGLDGIVERLTHIIFSLVDVRPRGDIKPDER